jgi:hypothetical protein
MNTPLTPDLDIRQSKGENAGLDFDEVYRLQVVCGGSRSQDIKERVRRE